MQLFKYRMLSIFRSKIIIFWSLIFPLIMATFFNIAFSNILNGEILDTINIVIVDNGNASSELIELIENIQINDNKMFNLKILDKETALELLVDDEVSGVIEIENDKILLQVNKTGFNQTIIKSFFDNVVQSSLAINELITINHENIDEIIADFSNDINYIDEINNSRSSANLILILYFSLIGMTLIYGGFWGTDNIINLQANMTDKGVRVAASPVNRLKVLLIYTLCAFIIHILIITILLFYIIVILNIDFGGKLLYTFLVCILGSLMGISFGSFTAIALKKAKESVKILITVLVGIVGGFLSGMMAVDIKYYVQTYFPALNYINPVAIVTDALYTLNYFGPSPRFFNNIINIVVLIIIFTLGTYLFYRRDNYESI